ncbi:MAG: hypothetical protein ACE5I3_09210 [Phycisphaerae bacterium]
MSQNTTRDRDRLLEYVGGQAVRRLPQVHLGARGFAHCELCRNFEFSHWLSLRVKELLLE